MSNKEVIPDPNFSSFTCPHCKAIAHQSWYKVGLSAYKRGATPTQLRPDLADFLDSDEAPDIDADEKKMLLERLSGQLTLKIFDDGYLTRDVLPKLGNLHVSKCYSCGEYVLWQSYEIIWPETDSQFEPNEDMPDEVREIFLEASGLFNKSPRASAALLRLSIECLCNSLNGKVLSINNGIAELVKIGLNERTQRALDIVRVTGNDAVHPGQINLNDNPSVAARLFKLVNVIVEELISLPAEIDSIYESLPDSKIEAINRRDKKS